MPVRLWSEEGIAQPDGSVKGQVETWRDGFWGSTCAPLGTLEAAVVCRQLGYSGSPWASTASSAASTQRLVWINSTQCAGSEASLLDCQHQAMNASSCASGYAVVQCYPLGEPPLPPPPLLSLLLLLLLLLLLS